MRGINLRLRSLSVQRVIEHYANGPKWIGFVAPTPQIWVEPLTLVDKQLETGSGALMFQQRVSCACKRADVRILQIGHEFFAQCPCGRRSRAGKDTFDAMAAWHELQGLPPLKRGRILTKIILALFAVAGGIGVVGSLVEGN